MEAILRKTVKDFSKTNETIQTIVIGLLAFLVPTFLGKLLSEVFGPQSIVATNSQLIIGSIINTALVLTALNIKGWPRVLLVVFMPSVSTMLSGFIFGSASVFMMYMVSAIWLGNFALVMAFKYLMLHRNINYILTAIIGIIVKVGIIFGFFMILKSFNIFPAKAVATLQQAMSITQVITATIGCAIGFAVYNLEKNK